jgi:hypothetical protein
MPLIETRARVRGDERPFVGSTSLRRLLHVAVEGQEIFPECLDSGMVARNRSGRKQKEMKIAHSDHFMFSR